MKRFDPLTLIIVLASIAGFAFAAVSTADFVAHLDRQVHGIHCSFLPGLSEADQTGESGCHATMMSPYSSVFREAVWGGIPIALPAMAVFAFIAFLSSWLAINGHARQKQATGFLLLSTLVPLGASVVMGYLSFAELDAACKMCIGIYAASGIIFLAALTQFILSEATVALPATGRTADGDGPRPGSVAEGTAPLPISTMAMAFVTGLVFVLVPVAAYAARAPDFSNYVGSCGSLPHPGHDPGALIPFGPQKGRAQMLEVFDPLCPSCRAFEERFEKMDLSGQVDRKLLLFPLDESCNWMIDRSIHPGACSISEAVLCADQPDAVMEWAFEHQKEIMLAAEKDPKAAARMVTQQFPGLANCVGGAEVQARLNSALRWAVKNRLQVLTPQVFVNDLRLCGEDTDLGLDYALPRLLTRAKGQVRAVPQAEGDQEEEAEGSGEREAAPEKPKPAVKKGSPEDDESDKGPDAQGDVGEEASDQPDRTKAAKDAMFGSDKDKVANTEAAPTDAAKKETAAPAPAPAPSPAPSPEKTEAIE